MDRWHDVRFCRSCVLLQKYDVAFVRSKCLAQLSSGVLIGHIYFAQVMQVDSLRQATKLKPRLVDLCFVDMYLVFLRKGIDSSTR